MSRLLISAAVLLISASAGAVDSTIRVMAVVTSDANTLAISTQLTRLQLVWNQSVDVIIPIELVNGGIPFLLSGGPLSGEDWEQLEEAQLPNRNLSTLRDQNAADIVVIFAGSFSPSSCGYGKQSIWKNGGSTGAFVPSVDPPFLDLRSRDLYFAAIISTEVDCQYSSLVAHEFGHLLGGGHELGAPGEGSYMFDDSQANVWDGSSAPEPISSKKTILARGSASIPICLNSIRGYCITVNYYSDGTGGYLGDTTTENAKAFELVALSVANYRVSETSCALSPPHEVSGYPTDPCYSVDPPETKHYMYWEDSCEEETDYYEVYYSFLIPSGPFYYGWSTSERYTNVFNNTSGFLAVKACNSEGCSSKSSDMYHAHFLCWYF